MESARSPQSNDGTADTEGPGINAVGVTVTSKFFRTNEVTVPSDPLFQRLEQMQRLDAVVCIEGVISQWRVLIENFRMSIRYTCVTNVALGTCSTKTETYFGRLEAACSERQALQSWKLQKL